MPSRGRILDFHEAQKSTCFVGGNVLWTMPVVTIFKNCSGEAITFGGGQPILNSFFTGNLYLDFVDSARRLEGLFDKIYDFLGRFN